jgi:hypothetical protein
MKNLLLARRFIYLKRLPRSARPVNGKSAQAAVALIH